MAGRRSCGMARGPCMFSGRRTSHPEPSGSDAGRLQAPDPARLCVGRRCSHAPRRPRARSGRSPMPRFCFTDGGGDVMGGSNAVFGPVDHRKPDVRSNGTGSRIQHHRRSGGAGRAPCSRGRTGPVPHRRRVKDVDRPFRPARCQRTGVRRAPFVQGFAGRTCHSNRRESATACQIGTTQPMAVPAVTCRTVAASARICPAAAPISPASRATRAASIAVSNPASVGALATLLHDSGLVAFSAALPLSRESAEAPDSSPECALPIAPASSGKIAGPTFDSRRPHKTY